MKNKKVDSNQIQLPLEYLDELDNVWKLYLKKNKLTEDILVELTK